MATKKNAKQPNPLKVEALKHEDAKRKNIPTAEYQSIVSDEQQAPVRVSYPRGGKGLDAEKAARNVDLDPQLVWRGKDAKDWSDLIVNAPPLYIQEKVHPKVLVDDLQRAMRKRGDGSSHDGEQIDLFADFNGVPDGDAKTEFYQHDAHWSNRMILGDSLQVMASLAEREGLRGKVQCIYLDPPYGIKFNSNFQWSTTSRDVKDGNADHITREPEQVKAFRDTWRDGIHSYLSYLRDRLTVARDLLTESGSIFVQIGDENVHRVRATLDEIFGDENFIVEIIFKKKGAQKGELIENVFDVILMYARQKRAVKFRHIFQPRDAEADEIFSENITGGGTFKTQVFDFIHRGRSFRPASNNSWKTASLGMLRIQRADRILTGRDQIRYARKNSDFPNTIVTNIWDDTGGAPDRRYVVETTPKVVQRCLLMSTDPGDLVLDPTCGSGTTAYVAEQWGRRWITIDTSRVALALARARIMGARYPYYLLADSVDGQRKEAEVTGTVPKSTPTRGSVQHGFVYERVPHVTLKSIANNAEIDVIWERYQQELEPVRSMLNKELGKRWEEWEIPRESHSDLSVKANEAHATWWKLRIARQKEIDASIAAKAEYEFLYDKPYEDRRKVRVAGPFTVESLSPHRMLAVDDNDKLVDRAAERSAGYESAALDDRDFTRIILENLRTSGVQQARRDDRITFTSLVPWPGELVCAEGRYLEGDPGVERRAAIFIGPEFGTVTRADLVAAAREAGDSGFDLLIACAFNYEARTTEFDKLGRLQVLKARMNADLHMADDLKNTGKGNLFVVFGEPDIGILNADDGRIRVKVNGVDVFHPNTGEVRSDGADGIACWFIDTDYNEESFFVRQAYFLGANDPYKALKTTLKAEIDEEAWASLNSDTSRAFDKPASGRIAVKVINHLGDEVMKIFRV